MHHGPVEYMKQNSPDGNFETQCYFQPFPSVIGTRGVAKGGNILGIEKLEDNAIVLLGSLAVDGADQEAVGRKKILEWKAALEEYRMSVEAFVAYRYSNYADASQDVLGSYGQENVRKMLIVSQKYDPSGVVQARMSGGFKLPLRPEALQEGSAGMSSLAWLSVEGSWHTRSMDLRCRDIYRDSDNELFEE